MSVSNHPFTLVAGLLVISTIHLGCSPGTDFASSFGSDAGSRRESEGDAATGVGTRLGGETLLDGGVANSAETEDSLAFDAGTRDEVSADTPEGAEPAPTADTLEGAEPAPTADTTDDSDADTAETETKADRADDEAIDVASSEPSERQGSTPDGEEPAAECQPGSKQACWEDEDGSALPGDPESLAGSCRRGERSCGSEGTWGPCVGAVVPRDSDSCSRPGADDDCNGVPNEGCECVTGDVRDCGSDVGACAVGTQTCTDNQWGPCEGAIDPAPQDSCEVPGDDSDCDGVANGGCPCIRDETEECGECGIRTCDPEARSWGACVGQDVSDSCWEDEQGNPLPALPLGTAVGGCALGMRSCGANGTWGACTGAVVPAPLDSCEVPGDDANCNGVANERCPCVGDETQACGECGEQQCDPAARDWAECGPGIDPPASRCVDGDSSVEVCGASGMWEETSCASSDADCVGSCDVVGSTAQCIVRAADADGDSVGSAACWEAPGQDCDDSNPDVHPGANEICDGIDNDCNGAADLDDGLELAGDITGIAGYVYPSIAWDYEAEKFGWVATNIAQLVLGTLETNGYVDEPNAPFKTVTQDLPQYRPFDLAYGDDSGAFGVVYMRTNSNPNEPIGVFPELALVDVDGNLLATQSLPGVGSIAARNDSDLVMARGGSKLTLASLDHLGVYEETDFNSADAEGPIIATSGTRMGIVFEYDGMVRWIQTDSSGQLDEVPFTVAVEGSDPAITGTDDGFALAWRTSDGFSVAHYEFGSHQALCGPVAIPHGDQEQSGSEELAMVDTQYGFLVLATDPGVPSLELFRFGHDCSLLNRVDLADDDVGVQIDLAAGGGYVGATWVGEVDDGKAGTLFRTFSDLLCK